MQFVHQTLAWGFLIVTVPVLIHLINMMRRRRIRWAAMEFLLQSHRKHRKWIWLKQLLLLLMRMGAIALIVAMLAGWVTRQQWLAIFGQQATHHFVLLDDSYSMSERTGGTSAFDRAMKVLGAVAKQAMEEDREQRFTLIRFSRAYGGGASAAAATPPEAPAGVADFNSERVDDDFDFLLEERRNSLEVTQLSVGPRPALEATRQMIAQGADEKRVVYIVSDFRSNQWDNPAEIREILRDLEKLGADLQLIGCAGDSATNLTISGLRPSDETRAAGVPLFVEVTVKNHGAAPARNVPLKLHSTCYGSQADSPDGADREEGDTAELPTLLIDEIPPGGSAVRRAQVYFPVAGQHVVQAALPEDPVAADNRRWRVIDFPEAEDVLVIDGDPDQRNAYYLVSAFQPGPKAATGIRPQVATVARLRDTTPDALRAYAAVYLLDVDRLDDRAVQNLEEYVAGGGGLGVFVGEHVHRADYNERLYRGGEGLLPLPLGRDDLLPPELDENTPDIEVSSHPVFSVFQGQRNPLIRLVSVDRFLRPQDGWTRPADSTVTIVARLRNRMPLAVERQFGRGRVILFLTTLAPDWNNWAHDPSFVVVLLKLQSYLASARRVDPSRLVGAPIELRLDAKKHRPDVTFVAPDASTGSSTEIERTAVRPQTSETALIASLGRSAAGGPPTGETDRSGVYEARLRTVDGRLEVRRYAVNVDPAEGDLTVTPPPSLLAKLDPVKVEFHWADQHAYAATQRAGFNRSLMLMGLLILLLLGEQVLAYSASYHPPRGGDR